MSGPRRRTDRCAPYRQMASQGTALLQRINPNGNPQDANCPETADAVNDFLNSGQVRQVRTASGTATFNFPRGLTWRQVPNLATFAAGMANCSHVVVRGVRNPAVQTVTPEHYFVLFRVDNIAWVADAYSIELTRDVNGYINEEPPQERMVRFFVASGGTYDIIVSDPLAGF
jgi:hypothetical protein